MSAAALTANQPFCQTAEQRRFVLIAAILGSSLAFIDGTIVSIAIPAMRESLGASLLDAQWFSNGYMLSLSALILVGGAMGDRFGLRKMFMIGIATFAIASLLCAVAPGSAFLIGARVVQGVGAAIMIPGSLAIISKAYPRDERGKAIGIWAAASALTTAIGPVVGGILLSFGSVEAWRLIFAINLPLALLALWFLWRKVPPDSATETKKLDWIGAALLTLVLGLLAFGLASGEEGVSAASSKLAWLAVPALIFLLVYVWWQRQIDHAVVPLHLFKSRVFTSANLVTFMVYFALAAILFFLPMTLIGNWGMQPVVVSFVFLPLSAFIALFSSLFGGMADRHGANKLVAAGCLVVAVSYGLLAVGMGLNRFWWHVFPSMCVMGLGMAILVSPLSAAVMSSVEDAMSGTASGINNAISRVSGLFAVATLTSMAASAYRAAGGQDSFGAILSSQTGNGAADAILTHLAAGNAGFAFVAAVSALLCLVAAAIALFGMKTRDSDLKSPEIHQNSTD